MFGVPMAAVSVIDGDRERSRRGVASPARRLLPPNCSALQALLGDGMLIAPRTARSRGTIRQSPLHRHPLAPPSACVRDGRPIGAISIMDDRPWAALAADRLAGLHALARLVEAELAAREAAQHHDDLRQRFTDLAEISSDLVWDTDAEHRFANFDTDVPGMAPLRPFALGKRRWEFRDSQPLKGTWADHIAVLEARQEFRDFEYKLVTSLGEAREMRISGRPVFDRRGGFVGYRGASTDITRQRAHERAIAAGGRNSGSWSNRLSMSSSPPIQRVASPARAPRPNAFWAQEPTR